MKRLLGLLLAGTAQGVCPTEDVEPKPDNWISHAAEILQNSTWRMTDITTGASSNGTARTTANLFLSSILIDGPTSCLERSTTHVYRCRESILAPGK